jgi:hypothetical protein
LFLLGDVGLQLLIHQNNLILLVNQSAAAVLFAKLLNQAVHLGNVFAGDAAPLLLEGEHFQQFQVLLLQFLILFLVIF